MARPNYAYEKRQREFAKKQKKEAKRQKQQIAEQGATSKEPEPNLPTRVTTTPEGAANAGGSV